MKFLCKRATPDSSSHVRHATADDVRNAFVEYREDLDWLALVLTGDHEMAEACIVDACTLATTENQVFEEWLEHWARRATIRSAIEMQRGRIVQLGTAYERRPCPHQEHTSLSPDIAELVRKQGDSLIPRMDVLCRCALVLRGIEDYSSREASVMLDVSRRALDAAYCAALDALAVLSCELLRDLDDSDEPSFGAC